MTGQKLGNYEIVDKLGEAAWAKCGEPAMSA
jgi:hypothetical protein